MIQSKIIFIPRQGKLKETGFNLYDELVDNIVSYNIEKSPFVFNPDSQSKIIWDLIGMVFIIYQGIIVPFRICFDAQAIGTQALIELIQDFYFLIDILISFNTGFYENGNLYMLRSKIICNYLKLWFWLDSAASFPYSLVVNSEEYFDLSGHGSSTEKAPQILRLLKFMRFMRFLRLIRVLKLKKILVRVNKIFNV
jgi:hypothetical protein